jgi:hypothetical protein
VKVATRVVGDCEVDLQSRWISVIPSSSVAFGGAHVHGTIGYGFVDALDRYFVQDNGPDLGARLVTEG